MLYLVNRAGLRLYLDLLITRLVLKGVANV
jgi:hypothetical protein